MVQHLRGLIWPDFHRDAQSSERSPFPVRTKTPQLLSHGTSGRAAVQTRLHQHSSCSSRHLRFGGIAAWRRRIARLRIPWRALVLVPWRPPILRSSPVVGVITIPYAFLIGMAKVSIRLRISVLVIVATLARSAHRVSRRSFRERDVLIPLHVDDGHQGINQGLDSPASIERAVRCPPRETVPRPPKRRPQEQLPQHTDRLDPHGRRR